MEGTLEKKSLLSNYEDSKKGKKKKNNTRTSQVQSKTDTGARARYNIQICSSKKNGKETGRGKAMMKEHGKIHRQQTPVPSHSIHSGGMQSRKEWKGRKCPENLRFPSRESPGWETGQRLHFLHAAEASSRAKMRCQERKKMTQEEKTRATRSF
jgi:hypothetical protein